MRRIWLLTLGLVLVFVCGCTSTAPPAQPTATSTIVLGTTPVPTLPKVASPETTAIPEVIPSSTLTQVLYSTNDIYKHFVDIAF
ncbi:MAG TPA: hypothetical protein VN227_06015, partial [Methanoregula sp.]|nr:hypothetical protein [Methanoregula sp.]